MIFDLPMDLVEAETYDSIELLTRGEFGDAQPDDPGPDPFLFCAPADPERPRPRAPSAESDIEVVAERGSEPRDPEPELEAGEAPERAPGRRSPGRDEPLRRRARRDPDEAWLEDARRASEEAWRETRAAPEEPKPRRRGLFPRLWRRRSADAWEERKEAAPDAETTTRKRRSLLGRVKRLGRSRSRKPEPPPPPPAAPERRPLASAPKCLPEPCLPAPPTPPPPPEPPGEPSPAPEPAGPEPPAASPGAPARRPRDEAGEPAYRPPPEEAAFQPLIAAPGVRQPAELPPRPVAPEHPIIGEVRLIIQLFYILDPEGRGWVTRDEVMATLPVLGYASAADLEDLARNEDLDERLDKVAFFEWYTRCTPQLAAQVRRKYPELF